MHTILENFLQEPFLHSVVHLTEKRQFPLFNQVGISTVAPFGIVPFTFRIFNDMRQIPCFFRPVYRLSQT